MPNALRHLTRDGWLLFATRFIRLFAYGALSVVLVFYLVSLGYGVDTAGLLVYFEKMDGTQTGSIAVSIIGAPRAMHSRSVGTMKPGIFE